MRSGRSDERAPREPREIRGCRRRPEPHAHRGECETRAPRLPERDSARGWGHECGHRGRYAQIEPCKCDELSRRGESRLLRRWCCRRLRRLRGNRGPADRDRSGGRRSRNSDSCFPSKVSFFPVSRASVLDADDTLEAGKNQAQSCKTPVDSGYSCYHGVRIARFWHNFRELTLEP